MDQETNEPLDDSKTSEDDIEMENDPFSVKTWKEDLKLIVEDKDIYVSKTVLALLSPVFEKMFESAFKEKDSNELPLPDKRFNSFVEFLQCVYPGYTKSVTGILIFDVLFDKHYMYAFTFVFATVMSAVKYEDG